ncbi:MAG: chorismate-binding protein [Crocinitomicaceae bacterium]
MESDFVIADFRQENIFNLKKTKTISLNQFTRYDSSNPPKSITQSQYLIDCKKTIDKIKQSHFDKVVLSRVVKLPLNRSLTDVFNDLNTTYKSAFVYMVSIDGFGTWIGASPESFLEYKDDTIKTTALAGTKINNATPWGEKEIEEQAIVSRFIEKSLKFFSENEITKVGPYTINTGSVLHIKTDFSCNIQQSNIKNLIQKLHPTPATCGLPQAEAKSFIQEIEMHQRSLYTGFLGPINKADGNLFVNLRCMEIIDKDAYLFVGGGVTADSDSEAEWKETVNKMKTLSPYLH